jgi:hypothetical protein
MDAKGWFAALPRPNWARITAYDIFKAAPARVLDVDTEIGKFAKYNDRKRLADEDWRALWERWCQLAVANAGRKAAP